MLLDSHTIQSSRLSPQFCSARVAYASSPAETRAQTVDITYHTVGGMGGFDAHPSLCVWIDYKREYGVGVQMIKAEQITTEHCKSRNA